MPNASSYESPLAQKRYGPDILSHVLDNELSGSEVGIPPGDVIRLKEGSTRWWNMGTGGKRKARSDSLLAISELEPSTSPARTQVISYEIQYPGGGGCRYLGGPLQEDATGLGYGDELGEGEKVFYSNDALGSMVPIPDGYIAPMPSKLDNSNPFA